LNLADAKGNTLLMLASYDGNLATTRMLLARGADVYADDGGGMTPPMFAAMFGRIRPCRTWPAVI